MTKRTFATWVEPIASVLAEDHRRVLDIAASAPPEFWNQSSGVEGWTNKHILAHLAGGNDQLVQIVLRSVTRREPPSPERHLAASFSVVTP